MPMPIIPAEQVNDSAAVKAEEERLKREDAQREREFRERERDFRDRERQYKEKERQSKEVKERLGKVGKGASIIGQLIVPVGIIALGYYVLKTWKVIGTAGSSWEALPEEELENESILLDSLYQ